MEESLGRLIELPRIKDERGCLTPIELASDIPFTVRRVYYLYDVPHDQPRGGHAHKQLHQVLIPVSGSLSIRLSTPMRTATFSLDQPNVGLVIPKMVWRDMYDFSAQAVVLVLASLPYDEEDYYRSWSDYYTNAKG